MRKVLLIFLVYLFQNQLYYTQCPENLIKNGSFELDTVGENITAMHWETLEGTPDIENADDLELPNGATYDFGIPESSKDGNNWQLLRSFFPESQNQDTLNESIGQSITFSTSVPHELSFEYASMAFTPTSIDQWLGAIDVLIDGEIIFTTDTNFELYTFEKAFLTFTPDTKNILLEFRTSKVKNPATLKIMGIDGICLKPITTGFFCEP